MKTCRLLRNRRKTYILDVIWNRFYFRDVQEEVLAQWRGEGISAPREKGLFVYLLSVPEKKKQAGWLGKCLCKYSTEVSRFVSEILEKIEGHCKSDSIKVCNTPWKYQDQKKGHLKYVAFFPADTRTLQRRCKNVLILVSKTS